MDKVNKSYKKEEEIEEEDTLIHKFGVKNNVVKGLGIASILGVIGFAAFRGYSRLQELEKIKTELEEELHLK
jgi:hypothetical protein